MEEAQFESIESKHFLSGIPVECFDVYKTHIGNFAPSHWHNEVEIILVREGGYKLFCGGVERELREGECILMGPLQIHRTICPDLPAIKLTVLKFDPNFMKNEFVLADVERLINHVYSERFSSILLNREAALKGDIIALFDRLQYEIRRHELGWRLNVQNYICMIFVSMLRAAQAAPAIAPAGFVPSSREFLPVFEYLNQHYLSRIQIETLLALCHLSYSRFSVKFRQFTGYSITEYINRMRINHARQLIQYGHMPINQVAEKCGLFDICYFDRLFRRYIGMSPSEFQKRCQAD